MALIDDHMDQDKVFGLVDDCLQAGAKARAIAPTDEQGQPDPFYVLRRIIEGMAEKYNLSPDKAQAFSNDLVKVCRRHFSDQIPTGTDPTTSAEKGGE